MCDLVFRWRAQQQARRQQHEPTAAGCAHRRCGVHGKCSDVSGDGKVTSLDALMILQAAVV